MTEYYQSLRVTHLTPEQSEKTCGPYTYTVTNRWAAHTAFVTKAGLDLWLNERGLSIHGDIETEQWCEIDGQYAKECEWLTPAEFELMEGQKIKLMDNGQWTLGIVNTSDGGATTVHYLNCNVQGRVVYPYFETSKERR